ncbi:MAG: SDR family NAD(P)-dependent oxidoreductase [Bacteriovoracaceae bacterium]|nr:SDR family NAD(P)-dependent oxidoreductase [Bacteriovoracaceae bacterium]
MKNKDLFEIQEVSLIGKTALVTGASSGIGFATACALAAVGVNLKLTGRRQERLQELKDLILKHCPSVQVSYLACDMREQESFSLLSTNKFFEVDILINNAGLVKGIDSVAQGQLEEWEEMIEVNVLAAFRVAQKVLLYQMQKGEGDIISIASIAGHISYAGGSVYCATKHALRAFATSLRYETAGKNIRCMTISPGMVETEFSVVRFRGDESLAKKVYEGMTPLTGKDVARQIVFALKQPRHVCLDEILVMASQQAGIKKV